VKSLICKIAVICLSLIAVTSASAAQCQAHNAKGMVFVANGVNRADATANVMQKCVRNSVYAKNCVIDWCNAGEWECHGGNARGQKFVGTGPTRAIAAANLMGYCAANSAYARNCYIKTCFQR